ncbi:MAG TPA: hypothetical protein VGV13_13240 [Methylomirabilota bacterium]|nr:hypothetical protein [Methylomirabilota bacterium]
MLTLAELLAARPAVLPYVLVPFVCPVMLVAGLELRVMIALGRN